MERPFLLRIYHIIIIIIQIIEGVSSRIIRSFLFLFLVLVLSDFTTCFFLYTWSIYLGFPVFWSFKGKREGNKAIIWGVGRSREWVGFQLKGWREKNGGVILFSTVCFWCFYEVCKLQISSSSLCTPRQLQNTGGRMMSCISHGYKSYMNIFTKLINGMVG